MSRKNKNNSHLSGPAKIIRTDFNDCKNPFMSLCTREPAYVSTELALLNVLDCICSNWNHETQNCKLMTQILIIHRHERRAQGLETWEEVEQKMEIWGHQLSAWSHFYVKQTGVSHFTAALKQSLLDFINEHNSYFDVRCCYLHLKRCVSYKCVNLCSNLEINVFCFTETGCCVWKTT